MSEDLICSACSGSGEGMYDGSFCWTCNGTGVERDGEYEDVCDKADYEYDQRREREYDKEWESRK